MPEMLFRFRQGVHYPRVRSMAQAALDRIQLLTGHTVGCEIREYGDCLGNMATFSITTWATDNKDQLIEVADKVEAEVLEIMQAHAFEEETVSHWVQRAKGKYGEAKGLRPKPA